MLVKPCDDGRTETIHLRNVEAAGQNAMCGAVVRRTLLVPIDRFGSADQAWCPECGRRWLLQIVPVADPPPGRTPAPPRPDHLTSEQQKEIFERVERLESLAEIGKRFGISKFQVIDIYRVIRRRRNAIDRINAQETANSAS